MFIITYLKEELKHLEEVFVMKNNFPIWVVKKILKVEKEKLYNKKNADKNNHTVQTDVKFESEYKIHLLLLPYQGKKGLHLTQSSEDNSSDIYIGESARQISKRIIITVEIEFAHFQPCHKHFLINNFKIIGNGFNNNFFKRKVSEALLIKQIKPSLNVQEKSVELKLFNLSIVSRLLKLF